jgi:hypothetical protein
MPVCLRRFTQGPQVTWGHLCRPTSARLLVQRTLTFQDALTSALDNTCCVDAAICQSKWLVKPLCSTVKKHHGTCICQPGQGLNCVSGQRYENGEIEHSGRM